MHERSNYPPYIPPDEPPILAEPVEQRKKPWLLIVLFGASGLFILVTLSGLTLLVFAKSMTQSGPASSLAGTWIHVDVPPSRAAKALMSVGSEVISDRVYVFSRYGSVKRKTYRSGARGPVIEEFGKWRMAPDQNGSDDEFTILIEFPDREPIRMHVRFIDRENAEFRFHNDIADAYYKVK